MDELLSHLSDQGITCQGYADVIVIMSRGKFEGTLCDIVQRGLKLTSRWCQNVGLNLNPIKITLIAFTKKRKLNLDHPVKLNAVVLKWKQDTKYL